MRSILFPDSNSKGNEVDIVQDEHGFTHLVCDCSDFALKSWCSHVKKIYMNDDYLRGNLPKQQQPIVEHAHAS